MNAVALSVGKVTHIGQVRSRNEDSMDLRQAEGDGEPSLFVVADGMGGHSAGNVASKMAVEQTISRFFASKGDDLSERLRKAIEEANREIFDASQANADYFRMGTTIVAAAVLGNRADIANVGDSRVYVVRNGLIRQVTRDHSWVALQVEMGELTPEEALVSQNRSVLLRCLGEKSDVLVDMVHVRLRPNDIILLCSDGLHGLVNPEELRTAVTSADPQKAADDLVALANARGGTDNITVQVVRVDACPEPPPDEGEELVVHRVAHVETLVDEAPVPLAEAAPATVPVPAQAPRYAPPPPAYPVPGSNGPPSPPPTAQVPWLLIVLALLAGAIMMAVVDRLYMQPPGGGPLPESSAAISSPLPTIMPTSILSSPFPSGLPGLESPVPSSAPSSGASGSVAIPPVGASPGARAALEGELVTERSEPIRSLVVVGRTLYWLEGQGGVVWQLPPGSPRPSQFPIEKARALAAGPDALFVGFDTHVGRVEKVARGLVLKESAVAPSGPVKWLAASKQTVYWVEDSSRELNAFPLGSRSTPQPPVRKGKEDFLGLVVPSGGQVVYWADSAGIFALDKDEPLVSAHVTALAADATHLYWTEDSGEGDVVIRRCSLDGKNIEKVATVNGSARGLAVGEDRLYWVVSHAEKFSVRELGKEEILRGRE